MKPDIVEFTYPLGQGQVISSVTWPQWRAVNLSPRTLRESLGDHYGHCHCYRHIFDLGIHPYGHSSPQPLLLQRAHCRPEVQKISYDMASQ